jgi:NADH-quinone oxidoreductase subunit M
MALLSSFSPSEVFLADRVSLFRAYMVMGGIGTVLTAGYFLWMLQRVNMGTLPDRWREAGLRDVLAVEWVSWLPLLALILVLGLYPRLVFGVTDEAVGGLMRLLGG